MSSRALFAVLVQMGVVRLVASKAYMTPGTRLCHASPIVMGSMAVDVNVAHTTLVPAAPPLADRLRMPPGCVGVAPAYCERGAALSWDPLNVYDRSDPLSGHT